MKIRILFFIYLSISSCAKEVVQPAFFNYSLYSIDGVENNYAYYNAGLKPSILVSFNASLELLNAQKAVNLYSSGENIPLNISLIHGDSTLKVEPAIPLKNLTKYNFEISDKLISKSGSKFSTSLSTTFTTLIDPADKFPKISDDSLLTIVQKQTFKYFWEFGHPTSGLARERNSSGDLVTTGGSGFGIMAILVGIERGFITRQQGLQRLTLIVDFLKNKTKTYHGVFPHWLNGSTGETIPFSPKDDGGDLVETSYLIAGLLAASEYFQEQNADEITLRSSISSIWQAVEWDWHTKGSENVLYWHWSPKYFWEMNHQIKGWNEALITYILAASSPTHPISKEVYLNGWASQGAIKNNRSFYGINLPLGSDLGGPLFFAHYSFLGIDPRNLKDTYADYWMQVVNHSKINYEYCKNNPRRYNGYGEDCWGLTASDTNNGYDAHSPTNDKGVISPTAALSSMPYTPVESKKALRFFYYTLGDKIFKQYGFIDAFNLTNIWFADSFLAIDQGPVIVMLENYRSGLIWNTTMRNSDIRSGLTKLGFTY